MKENKNNLPKISIVIPSLNKAQYIEKTLQSIVGQNYPQLEVIIQDGGSTDGSLGIIRKYGQKYPGIFYWVSRKDNGQVDAINRGLQKATGDIVTYINADDIYNNNVFWNIGRVFQKYPGTLWVTGYGDIIDMNGKKFSSLVTTYKNLLLRINNFFVLLMVNYLTQPATFINKTAYLRYGPFTGTKKFVLEYDLWLKLGKVQMPVVIRKNLASFRLTTDNISATSFRELLSLDNQIVKRHSGNWIILLFHYLHNLGRIGLIFFVKRA